ncbi:leucine-rich repeat-containing protein 71-like isoform X2 [Dysidea avara]|uniref:leucine-rich repeat-containing protein 71-like isoform X2 n=1 Tax=Dysidea avara TaxID=196820 RepID=UPI00331811DE
MKKAGRQSHPGKSTTLKHDTSVADIEGEGNSLTGMFSEDFSTMCEREGLIKIPLLVHTPSTQCDPSVPSGEDLSSSKIHVTVEADEDPNSVKHINVRNLKMNDKLMNALVEATAKCTTLSMFSLWHTGRLSETVIEKMIGWVGTQNIRYLALDGCQIPTTIFNHLLGAQSKAMLQKLSLRCCQLNNTYCEHIGPSLEENKSLLCLNLGCNSITDNGLRHINKALKRNRTLLSLSLSGNRIGDDGVIELAQILSRFSLSHAEIVNRRKQLLEKKADEEHQLSIRSSPSTASLSDRSSRQTKGSTIDKNKAARSRVDSTAKKEDKVKKEDKTKKGVASPDATKKGQKGGRDSSKAATAMAGAKKPVPIDSHPPSPKVETTEPAGDPLLEEGEEVDGTIVLPAAFLLAIEIQKQYSSRGQGLLRLSFKPNSFPSTSVIAKRLEEVMLVRDPYYEPPPPEEDTVDNLTTPPAT